MAEFARGRVCRGLLCQGPSLSGAKFVRGRDVQYPWETTGPIKVKFHIELLWDEVMKVYSNCPGHMTKMAAMHICGKNLKKIFFSGTKRPMTLKLDMHHRVLKYYKVCSNDDPGLTFTYLTTKSNLVPDAFVWEKGKTMDFLKNYCRLWFEISNR